MKILNHKSLILILLLLSFFAIKPLFHPGFFPVHDDTQVVRVSQMAQALADGQFPVRWVADLGYGFGYPIFNFYGPLAYYVGGFFNLIGFSALVATKIMLGLGIILAGVSMYFLAKEFFGHLGGLLAGLFYLYAPYHAVQIYVRGAIGELWAYAFLPLVFLGVSRQNLWLAGLSLAAVILSHNLTALMLMPFLFSTLLFLFFFSKNKKKFMLGTSRFVLLAAGLAAFYWLPALSEMHLTKVFGQLGGGADWQDHFVFPDQLWVSSWGFGGSAPGRLDGMSFILGKLHWLAIAASVVWIVYQICRRRFWTHLRLMVINLFIFSLAIFLMLPVSAPIWQVVKPMAFIQYPWRFLIFTSFATSFAAASLLKIIRNKMIQIILAIGLAILVIGLNDHYFQPQKYASVDYLEETNVKWTTSKISDEYLPRNFPVPASQDEVAWQKVEILSGEAMIDQPEFRAHRYQFAVDGQTDSQILVNLAYFPGWRVWLDGEQIKPQITNGKVLLDVPAGQHQVKFRFTNTPIRWLANLLSLIAIFRSGIGIYLTIRDRSSVLQ